MTVLVSKSPVSRQGKEAETAMDRSVRMAWMLSLCIILGASLFLGILFLTSNRG